MAPVGQNAAVEHAAEKDIDAFGLAQWKEFLERPLFQEGVAPSQQEAIEFSAPGKLSLMLPMVHARPNRPNHPLRLQVRQDRIGLIEHIGKICVGIVDEGHVQVIHLQSPQVFFDAALGTLLAGK